MLISHFRAREVYSKVMSNRAEEILDRYRMKHLSKGQMSVSSPFLIASTILFERIAPSIEDPRDRYERIRKGMESI